eukprot:scaffold505228_cov15-Prasinocladus_malaysianus.AAC.2
MVCNSYRMRIHTRTTSDIAPCGTSTRRYVPRTGLLVVLVPALGVTVPYERLFYYGQRIRYEYDTLRAEERTSADHGGQMSDGCQIKGQMSSSSSVDRHGSDCEYEYSYSHWYRTGRLAGAGRPP